MLNYGQINNNSYYTESLFEQKEERIDFKSCQNLLYSLESYSKKLDKLIEITTKTEKNNNKD